MTAQEAIKVIEAHFCDKCMMTSCEHCAQGKAKEALEKQIPKKAVDVKRFQTGLQGKCPVCGGHLLRMKYCQGCGQRIDWSED